MPLTIPSHPGLVLPLWMRDPARYDAAALAVGSVMPDVVDLTVAHTTGPPDFKLVHWLVGLVAIGIPLGFGIVASLNPACRMLLHCRVPGLRGQGRSFLERLIARPFRWRRSLASVAIGGVSHLVFDAFSHSRFEWLGPWLQIDLLEILPRGFSGPWLHVPIPGYQRPLGIWFFDLGWLALTLAGGVLFFLACRKGRELPTWR